LKVWVFRLPVSAAPIAALFLAAALAGPTFLPAQTAGEVKSLTLDEAISLALDHGEAVRQARAGLAVALADATRARAQRYPQLDGRAAYTRTLASEFEDIDLSFGDDSDGGSDDGLGDLPFGQKNRYDLGIAGSQVLWAGGGVRAAEKAARHAVDAAQVSVEAARAALTLDVVAAYFDAALADRIVLITEASFQQAENTLGQAKAAFDVGNAAEFDVLRAQVAMDNERPTLLERRSLRNLAHLRLRQLLDLPADASLRLSTEAPTSQSFAGAVAAIEHPTLPATSDPAAPVADPIAALAARRAPVRQAQALVAVREELVRVARAARWPNVALTSDYGRVAYPASGLPSWGDTRDNWTVGIGVRVPIFRGGALQADVLAAEARLEDARAARDAAAKLATLEARDVIERLSTAREVWRVSSGVVEQARRAYDIADVRYREGISTQLELDNARLLLRQAEGNRALAARDLEIAQARVALLAELPLGASAQLTLSIDRSGGR
jgi:outer membrane protein